MVRLAKFFLRLLLRLLYRVEVSGLENYARAGDRVLIVANHTSLLDGILLYAWLPETPTFAINTEIASRKLFKPFLYFVKLYELDAINPLAIKSMIKYIKQNKKAVIFPEGRITITGTLMKIYEGPGLIADKSNASVLPVAIDGAQYSRMSYMKGRSDVFWFPKITIKVLPPEKIEVHDELIGHERRKAAARQLQDVMYKLIYFSANQNQTLFQSLVAAKDRFGKNKILLEDNSREKINYKQLILRSMLLGSLIKKQTADSEHIGILLPNINAMPIVFFALQFIGRVPALLNFSAGTLMIKRACETAQIKTIYTSRKFIEHAKLDKLSAELEKNYNLIYLEDLKEKITPVIKIAALLKSLSPSWHYGRQQINTNPDSPAVILFTSGSEGQPKGVVLSHKNLIANNAQVRCHIHFTSSDITFCCLPLFHSFGLNAGFLMSVFGGCKVFLYPTPLHYRIIPELIYEVGATILYSTNTFLKGYSRYAHPFDFISLKYVVAGAEKLHEDTMRLWSDKYGHRILQGYGVTETSPVLSVNNKMQNKRGTVGRIMPGMECYIKPVEGIEQGGHLVVKGPNVMLGYLLSNKPGLIQPPSTERGAGWYDTGDIADIDHEGYISILGRAKRFAKIGGEMVSLSSAEELASLAWPNIPHAAVSIPDERKGEKIILVTEHKEASRKELQEIARANQMGELIIPKKVLVMHKIPVLGTGKIDYLGLQKIIETEESGEKHEDSLMDILSRLVKHNKD